MMGTMKVLFISPKAPLSGYSKLFLPSDEMNLGLLCIDASCREQGHETQVALLSVEEAGDAVRSFGPDAVGITSLTPTYPTAVRIAQEVKKADPSVITVFGGHHVSALPEETVKLPCADYVIRGEGELAFNELLEQVSRGNREPEIEGVCYEKNGVCINAESKAIIEDLDALPFIDQDILENQRVFIVSSRGCPYQCDFCSVGSFYERRWRKRSVESIIAEIKVNEEKRRRQGKKLTWIDFRDDNLTVDSARLLELCDRIEQEQWDVSWHCQSRVDTLLKNPGMLDRMKETGCSFVGFGLESGVQEILDSYHKGITFEQSKEAAALLTSRKVLHIWYAMLGSGDHLDTPEMLKENIEQIASFPFDLLQISLLTPFPGTPLYDRLVKEDRLLHRDWERYDGLHCVYKPQGIDPEAMEKAFLWAYRRVFINSGLARIVHTIKCSRPFWGNTISPVSLLKVARDMIILKRDMF